MTFRICHFPNHVESVELQPREKLQPSPVWAYNSSVRERKSSVVESTKGSYWIKVDIEKALLTDRRSWAWKDSDVVLKREGRRWPPATDCWTG